MPYPCELSSSPRFTTGRADALHKFRVVWSEHRGCAYGLAYSTRDGLAAAIGAPHDAMRSCRVPQPAAYGKLWRTDASDTGYETTADEVIRKFLSRARASVALPDVHPARSSVAVVLEPSRHVCASSSKHADSYTARQGPREARHPLPFRRDTRQQPWLSAAWRS